jgi:Uma2 family endonuclease
MMPVVTAPIEVAGETPPRVPAEQHFLLSGVTWEAYLAFDKLLEGRHVRLTYDRGELEFMTVSSEHERGKSLLRRLLEALSEELNREIASLGSMTCRREEQAVGLEPDECYYVTNEPRVRGRDDIDLTRDPPPDLMLEIEISRNSLNRMRLCARLGVPEIWRSDGQTVRFFVLGPDGRYTESEHHRAFPFLRAHDLSRFLAQRGTMGENSLVRAFREWVRDQIARGWTPPQPPAS